MNYSLFMTPYQGAWQLDTDDPQEGDFVGQLLGQTRQNVLYRKIENMSLEESDTRSVTLGVALTSQWIVIIAKVIGNASINLAGFDVDGTTPITSEIAGFGNSVFPGIITISTYNLSTITVEGLADDTTVELFAAMACTDDDARLIT